MYEARNRQVEGEKEKTLQLKRLKNPRRYRCAAVGCGVEADSGKMLSRGRSYSLSFYSVPLMRKYLKGSGKCDFDKKTLLLQYRVPKS